MTNKYLLVGLLLLALLCCNVVANGLPFSVGKVETKQVNPMSQKEYDAYIAKLKATGEYQKMQEARPKRGACGTMKIYQQHQQELKRKQMEQNRKKRQLEKEVEMLSNMLDK